MSLREQLLYELGVQCQHNLCYDVLQVAGDDRVMWERSPAVGPWSRPTPMMSCTLVKLHTGETVGYTHLQIPNNHQYCHLPKLPQMPLLGPSQNVPPTVTIREVTLERKRDHFVFSGKREDLEDAREVTLFHQPPAVRTTLIAYGHPVWWYLDKDELIAEDEDHGVWHAVPWPTTIYELYSMLQGGYGYGQHRQTAQTNHGYSAAGAGQGAGALGSGSTYHRALASQAAGASLILQQAWKHIRTTVERQPLLREVRTGELIAWRGWATIHEHPFAGGMINITPKLTSIYKTEYEWHPGKTFESKPPNDHDHDDGVHAFKTQADAERYLQNSYNSKIIVLGKVRLWGEVVECEVGYRAQFAAVESLVAILNNVVIVQGNPNYTKLRIADPDRLLAELKELYDDPAEPA